jgi:hypothetical protein
MLSRDRYLETAIKEDLEKKMAFIGGPRQVGKTTLARRLGDAASHAVYLNWDFQPHRLAIKSAHWKPETDLLILDEVHKFPRWKNLVKGIWDTKSENMRIIVTGSSRLDTFRRGGDSLQGRYHAYRLHPFSLREVNNLNPPDDLSATSLSDFPEALTGLVDLQRWGGFPEPFLAGNDRQWRRWRRERFDRVFREDIRDTELVRALGQVELLAALMPPRIGSPVSIRSLSEDVEASPKTVQSWLDLLCRNYYLFRVPPWHRRLDRALRKESKYYFWDWAEAPEGGQRFENMVAGHLLKFCHYAQDVFGWRVELYYVRDREKREVDFLVVWEQQPLVLVECKSRPDRMYTSAAYFARKLGVKAAYVVTLDDKADYVERKNGVRVIPASRFLSGLV